eukprot:5091804-Pleurochrysis_carterae.AAC.4
MSINSKWRGTVDPSAGSNEINCAKESSVGTSVKLPLTSELVHFVDAAVLVGEDGAEASKPMWPSSADAADATEGAGSRAHRHVRSICGARKTSAETDAGKARALGEGGAWRC